MDPNKPDEALKYTLYGQLLYHQGNPIVVGFRLENLGDHDVWVLKWYTPLEGLRGRIFEVDCDGAAIPYGGRMIKRGDPSASEYLRLAPGNPLSADVDLAQAYTLPTAKECRVRFKGRIHDVVVDHARVPRGAANHTPITITGNELRFAIV